MTWKRLLGLDNKSEKYAYHRDPVLGYTTQQRTPTKWVKSTCGYCSVGCGMELGVSDNQIVAVKGWDSHPVNLGKLCPKGLSEHQMVNTTTRAQFPLRRIGDQFVRTTWDDALTEMAEKFKSVQAKYGPQSVAVISTGQLLTEEFYTLGKLVQLGIGTTNYDGNTTLCISAALAVMDRPAHMKILSSPKRSF
jgi:predicted molibdopterin-dependent oxidoreductase YjgC